MTKIFSLFALCLPVLVMAGKAQKPVKGITFEHKDWQLVCDNTGTCRAAGYQLEDETERLVSVLLTRKAGDDSKVRGAVKLALAENLHIAQSSPTAVHLTINGKNYGKVSLNSQTHRGTLTAKQTQALLKVLPHTSTISFSDGKRTWLLSDRGATAVLVRMDAFQQRVGKPSALVKTGKDVTPSLQPAPKPTIRQAPVMRGKPTIIKGSMKDYAPLRKKLLRASAHALKADEDEVRCYQLDDADGTENRPYPAISLYPLNGQYILAEVLCNRAAYNGENLYAVLDKKRATVQSISYGGNYQQGVISQYVKVRGVGDCGYQTTAVWNGKHFVPSEAIQTGLCRAYPGGFWQLPEFVSTVKVSKATANTKAKDAQRAEPHPAASKQILDTPHYRVVIQSRCPKHDSRGVGCIHYLGKSKKTGNSIQLTGDKWYATCADGKTPCRFLGYIFKKGSVVYSVKVMGDKGHLLVKQKGKVLVDEQGKWLSGKSEAKSHNSHKNGNKKPEAAVHRDASAKAAEKSASNTAENATETSKSAEKSGEGGNMAEYYDAALSAMQSYPVPDAYQRFSHSQAAWQTYAKAHCGLFDNARTAKVGNAGQHCLSSLRQQRVAVMKELGLIFDKSYNGKLVKKGGVVEDDSGEGDGIAEYADYAISLLMRAKVSDAYERFSTSQDRWAEYVGAHCAIFKGLSDKRMQNAHSQCQNLLRAQRIEAIVEIAKYFK